MAGGTRTCDTSIEKFVMPSRWPARRPCALAGAVVSKPTAKKTTCCDRDSRARASRHRAANRRCARRAPSRLAPEADPLREPGTRSMSPKEQKITSGRAAIAIALSISSSGVTHTGQPGPCTSVDFWRQQFVDAVLARWCASARRRLP